jgi:hypothetical protein
MTLTELVVAALATWQAVEVWHHGSLFADIRAKAELRADAAGFGGWLARLLLCPFCLSVWVAAAALTVTVLVPPVAWVLAAARLANLGNDVFHARCRTPGRAKDAFRAAVDARVEEAILLAEGAADGGRHFEDERNDEFPGY